MAIDTSMLAFPKARPKRLEKQDHAKVQAAIERIENDLVKKRSGGRCEVIVVTGTTEKRCRRRANQIHHMLGGSGRRGIGISALAKHKQHVCDQCHPDITGHVLRLLGLGASLQPEFSCRYERIK